MEIKNRVPGASFRRSTKSVQGETMSGAVPQQEAVVRRFPRFAIDVRVSVHVHRVLGTESFWGRTSELGEDGVGATLTNEIEPGEVVAMELVLPLTPYPLKFRAL